MLRLKWVGILVAIAAFGAACSGGSDAADEPRVDPVETAEPEPENAEPQVDEPDPAPTATPEVPTAEATAEPTIEPTVAPPSSDDLIAAAVAAYEQSDQAAAWFDWELISSLDRTEGVIDLDICTWDGETVTNQVRTARMQVDGDSTDSLTAEVLTEFVGPGECTNTAMIESAIEAIESFDRAWATASADPSRADDLLLDVTSGEALATAVGTIAEREAEGVRWTTAALPDTSYPADLIESVLYRSSGGDTETDFELTTCSPMNPAFGVYRDGVLIDDFKPEVNGPHRIVQHRLTVGPEPGSFRVFDFDGLSWSDCVNVGSWVESAERWKPGSSWREWVPSP